MEVKFIGEPLTVPGSQEKDESCHIGIATVFTGTGVVVTLPGVHTTQRMAYTDRIDQERHTQGLAPLTSDERMEIWRDAVDLLMDVLIILWGDFGRFDFLVDLCSEL